MLLLRIICGKNLNGATDIITESRSDGRVGVCSSDHSSGRAPCSVEDARWNFVVNSSLGRVIFTDSMVWYHTQTVSKIIKKSLYTNSYVQLECQKSRPTCQKNKLI